MQRLDGFRVSDLGEAQFLGHLRTDLSCIAVDRLPSAKDKVVVTDMFNGAFEGIGSGQGVRSGKLPIGEQDHPIGAAVERIP